MQITVTEKIAESQQKYTGKKSKLPAMHQGWAVNIFSQ